MEKMPLFKRKLKMKHYNIHVVQICPVPGGNMTKAYSFLLLNDYLYDINYLDMHILVFPGVKMHAALTMKSES